MFKDKERENLGDEIDAQPHEITKYYDFPLLEDFSIEEYAELMKRETEDEEN